MTEPDDGAAVDGPDRAGLRALVEIVHSGVASVRHHPLRHAVTGLTVVALLVPYLVGVGVSRGLLDQTADAVAYGADLYVGGERTGVSVPLPRSVWDDVRLVPGVQRVAPRIVASVRLGKRDEAVVLVGVPNPSSDAAGEIVRGRLPEAENEIVVGSVLARELGLDVGARLPPFYRSASGERVSTVVGVFRDDGPVWQSHVLLATYDTAARIVDSPDAATDLLVWCEPDDAERVAQAIRRLEPTMPDRSAGPRLRVLSRDSLQLSASRDLLHQEGIFHALFALVIATGVPILLVTSGAGLRDRRAETGLLRATGWRVDEVLLRAAAENVTVATIAGAAAVVLTWTWLELLGGWGVAPVFLRGASPSAGFEVPFRLTPLPTLLGFALAYALVLAGSVTATWRAASVPPARAMR